MAKEVEEVEEVVEVGEGVEPKDVDRVIRNEVPDVAELDAMGVWDARVGVGGARVEAEEGEEREEAGEVEARVWDQVPSDERDDECAVASDVDGNAGSLPRLSASSSLVGVRPGGSSELLLAVITPGVEVGSDAVVIPSRADVQSWFTVAVLGDGRVEGGVVVWIGMRGGVGRDEEMGRGSAITSEAYGLVHTALLPPGLLPALPVPGGTVVGLDEDEGVAFVCPCPSSMALLTGDAAFVSNHSYRVDPPSGSPRQSQTHSSPWPGLLISTDEGGSNWLVLRRGWTCGVVGSMSTVTIVVYCLVACPRRRCRRRQWARQ